MTDTTNTGALEARVAVLEQTCHQLATALVALTEGDRSSAREALQEAQILLERVSRRQRQRGDRRDG